MARWAAGYDEGLKWNEKDKLKTDMMNWRARWAAAAVAQVRAKCSELGMQLRTSAPSRISFSAGRTVAGSTSEARSEIFTSATEGEVRDFGCIERND
ncbi:hypothetical protein ASF48_08925 [Rathayibacter sp. Leaf299]|nr:hypothetical protein ASF48_08925 [Rathayibacter sp. Leaf299]